MYIFVLRADREQLVILCLPLSKRWSNAVSLSKMEAKRSFLRVRKKKFKKKKRSVKSLWFPMWSRSRRPKAFRYFAIDFCDSTPHRVNKLQSLMIFLECDAAKYWDGETLPAITKRKNGVRVDPINDGPIFPFTYDVIVCTTWSKMKMTKKI